MKKEEINEFMNMTLEEKKAEIVKMIREIPEDSPIHKQLYEVLEREKEATICDQERNHMKEKTIIKLKSGDVFEIDGSYGDLVRPSSYPDMVLLEHKKNGERHLLKISLNDVLYVEEITQSTSGD